ncbi:MAG: DUF952 domain-containing protein [Burkholderiaceae bacterium]
MTLLVERVFHICSRAAAQRGIADGHLLPASLASDGFVHLSQSHQIGAVMAAFFKGVPDLVVLALDPARLTAPLRYEPPATLAHASDAGAAPQSGLFPHLYGPLNADAIVQILDTADFCARGRSPTA